MNDWGQGTKNNNIGWGQGSINNDINWGSIYADSYSGDTDIVGGNLFDADYQAVLDYATTQGYTLPSAGQQVLQNQMVIDLKSSGVWSKLDTFAKFDVDGDSNFALIDWKRLTQYTAVSNPTFTTNQGFAGNGTSSYINTNYNPFSEAVNFELNNATIGTYIRTAPASPIGVKSVYGTGDTDGITLLPQFSANCSLRLNATGGQGFASPDQVGTWIITRPSGTNTTAYRNGVLVSMSRISTGIIDRQIYLLRRNDATPMWWDGQISYFFAGACLTEIEAKTLTGILQNYLNGGVGNKLGVFFGDSITAGTGASATSNRWTSVFSGLQSIMEMNYGIAGTTMVQNPTTPTGDSMYERMSLIPNYVGADKYLFFAYGTNDSGGSTIYTPALFETQYNEVLDNAISKGWNTNKIKMVNIFRRDDTKEDAYNVILESISTARGIQLLDVNSVLASNPALYMSDSVHPNDAGHSAIANYINSNVTL
jgi:lysophospholipase L1-like esterase